MNSIVKPYVTTAFVIGIVIPGLFAPGPALSLAKNSSAASPDSQVESWKYDDLKALDPWGDSSGDAYDLIAVYEKHDNNLSYFRADVMDALTDSKPNLYFAIDYKAGGTSVLPAGQSKSADIQWDLLLSLSSTGERRVLDSTFREHPEFLENAAFDSTLDYAEFAIRREALSDWNSAPLTIQAFALNETGVVVDLTSPASTNATTGRGKLVLVFGNTFMANGPGAISWYDGFAFPAPDHPGQRGGYKYLLDAAEKYSLPLTLGDLRVETLPGLEYLGVNKRLRDLAGRGLLDLGSTATYGYYMPWQPADVDALALRLVRQQRDEFDLPQSAVYYPYESWLTAGDLGVIRSAGFPAIYASSEKYGDWFGQLKDSDWGVPGKVEGVWKAQLKIHKINGVLVFFGLQGISPDPRWSIFKNEPELANLQSRDKFVGTDGGLHHAWRRTLLDMALDSDQEQYISMGTDLMLTSWLFQGDAERSMRWLAAHPWIEVTTFSDLLTRNWTPVDHGDLGLAPDQPLDQFIDNRGHSAGDYFWQNYYGGISDGHSPLIPAGEKIESYFDYVPYLNGQPIPSGMKMGDDETPGTIVYETLRNLRASPDNSLTSLAWYTYLLNVAEQTIHASKDYESGANALGDPGGRFLHPSAKAEANHVRQVNKIVAAAHWAEEAALGKLSPGTQILRRDLDLDGEDEFILENDHVFAIFENDGGRLEYAFSYSSTGGALQWVGPFYQFQISGYSNFKDGETPPADWNSLDGAFEDRVIQAGENYRSLLYTAELTQSGLTFTSPDGRVRKTFTLEAETLGAHYQLRDLDRLTVGLALTPNATRFHSLDWWVGTKPMQTSRSVGWPASHGSTIFEFTGSRFNTLFSFLDDPYHDAMRELDPPASYTADHWQNFPFSVVTVIGSGEFDLHLTMSGRQIKVTDLPGATVGNSEILVLCTGLSAIVAVLFFGIILLRRMGKRSRLREM